MTDIPDITSPAVGIYLHEFVEVDSENNTYISPFNKERTKDKQSEIKDIILIGASSNEVEFLYSIEQDPTAKKLLKKAIKIVKPYE